MQILLIAFPGFVFGLLVADSLRRIFSDDDKLIWKLLKDQPATMGVSATTVGTLIVWVALTALGRDPHRRPAGRFMSFAASTCGIDHPAVSEVVDDVLVYAEVTAIDG